MGDPIVEHKHVEGNSGGNDNFTPRNSTTRPAYKLSVNLIDTYKYINKVYYETKAKKNQVKDEELRGGVHNNGFDDQNYDYIVKHEELINGRYVLKHRIGKGSFGQVVCAYDNESKCEVAVKIIKSRRPFTLQAQSELKLLSLVQEKDKEDECNVVRMINQFMFRNHQCIVFEMLSYNLYDLLRNTKFNGVSLNLVRKFAKQILRSLEFFAREDVDVIHCDLKPENILLKHPRRSGVKIIDLGSSCFAKKRTYTYIQSRFYRSPEILLGLTYDQKIDIWSLGCVLVELHTGEPLFAGTNQPDQMCKIVEVLGMPPVRMLNNTESSVRSQFFERVDDLNAAMPADCDRRFVAEVSAENSETHKPYFYVLRRPAGKTAPVPTAEDAQKRKTKKLRDIIGVDTGGPYGRRKGEAGHTVEKYEEFLDLISKLLCYDPSERISASDALLHPYLLPDAAPSSTTAGTEPTILRSGTLPAGTRAENLDSGLVHDASNRMEVDQSSEADDVNRVRPSSAPSKSSLTVKLRHVVKENKDSRGGDSLLSVRDDPAEASVHSPNTRPHAGDGAMDTSM